MLDFQKRKIKWINLEINRNIIISIKWVSQIWLINSTKWKENRSYNNNQKEKNIKFPAWSTKINKASRRKLKFIIMEFELKSISFKFILFYLITTNIILLYFHLIIIH
jgi:hypothetical protein